MKKGRQLALLSSVLTITALATATPVWATGTYYVDADSGNDANNCTTAATACKTIAAAKALIVALPDPGNTTLKLRGTFTEAVMFDDGNVVAPKTLDGLRVTAINNDHQPEINTSGVGTAVTISDLDHVTIDHLTITGGNTGIQVTGSTTTLATGVTIMHNDISGTTADNAFYGLYVSAVKNARIHHNAIHDITLTLTDETDYTTGQGMYLAQVSNSSVHHNTVEDITVTNSLSAAGSHTIYVYGMYVSGLDRVNLFDNTIRNISTTETASVDSTNHYSSTYGFYSTYATASNFHDNTVSHITVTLSADFANSYASSTVTGFMASDMRQGTSDMLIQKNTVQTVAATQSASSGSAISRGLELYYIYNTAIKNNTIKDITTSHVSTAAAASVSGSATGMYGPYFGNVAVIQNNRIQNISATGTYSTADSSSSLGVRGMYVYGTPSAVIQNNHVKNVSLTTNNNNAANYSDYLALYGLDVSFNNEAVLTGNTVKQLHTNYTTAGVAGYTSLSAYGLSYSYTDHGIVEKNIIQNMNVLSTIADVTDDSTLYQNTYPMSIIGASNMSIIGNQIKDITTTVDAGNANYGNHVAYGIYTNNTDGMIRANAITDYTDATTVGEGFTHTWYGIPVSSASAVQLDHNKINNVVSSSRGASVVHTTVAVEVTKSPEVLVYNNQIRDITSTAESVNHKMYGIRLASDASGARLLNNVVLGQADFAGAEYAGVYLPSDSTVDLDIVHNTLADWFYPLWIGGGNKVYAKNNILSAVGGNSYALALGRDLVEANTFKSDYNLLFNATTAEQLIYDTDNTVAIALGDWTNPTGSFGYDVHSLNANPKINGTGRLQASSPAKNAGTNDYPYSLKNQELLILAFDINGTKRPLQQVNKIDIGADEFKGK